MSDHDPTYWPKLHALLRQGAGEHPVFIDGGTNRGDFTARLREAWPGCTVHCVEADPELCAALESRFAGQPVHVHHAALHDREGEVHFEVHENRGTSSLLPRPRDARRYYASGDRVIARVPVRAITLDALAAQAKLDRVALLKLDTQGAELGILRGARGLLASGAVDVIYTEFFVVPHYEGAATLHELWAELAAHGYVLYDLFKGPYGRNGQLRFGDAIFVSPGVRARCLDAYPEEP